MKQLIALSAAVALAFSTSAFATTHKEAGDKKGDDRKAFMTTCLSSAKVSQQDKMKKCNVDAAGKKGDDRKAFMKECLSA